MSIIFFGVLATIARIETILFMDLYLQESGQDETLEYLEVACLKVFLGSSLSFKELLFTSRKSVEFITVRRTPVSCPGFSLISATVLLR